MDDEYESPPSCDNYEDDNYTSSPSSDYYKDEFDVSKYEAQKPPGFGKEFMGSEKDMDSSQEKGDKDLGPDYCKDDCDVSKHDAPKFSGSGEESMGCEIGVDSGDKDLGFHICLTDRRIIKLLKKMSKGQSVGSNKADAIYLFDDHPAIVLEYLEPCLRDETQYYLIFTALPEGSNEREIVDASGGRWVATIKPHAITEDAVAVGKRQRFVYIPSHRNTSTWRMVMYSLGFLDKTNHVICKVYEARDSDTAKAVREAAKAEAKKIKVWKLLAAAEDKAKTLKVMTATFEEKLNVLRNMEVKAVADAINLVAVRNEIARKELIELRRSRAAGNNGNNQD